MNITLKYIDPTYMIRSVKANSLDSYIWSLLSQNAVHAGMAGYTNWSIGVIKGHSALIPIQEIAKSKPSLVQ